MTSQPPGLSVVLSPDRARRGAAKTGFASVGVDAGRDGEGSQSDEETDEPEGNTGDEGSGDDAANISNSAPTPRSELNRVEGVAAFVGPAESNKSFDYDVYASRKLIYLLGKDPEGGSMDWRCTGARCADVSGLAKTIAKSADVKLSPPRRVDTSNEIAPVLAQQRAQGEQLGWIVMGLGLAAVTIVGVAFIGMRTPELVTLRTLGARRSTIAGLAMVESLVVATVVAALVICLGVALSTLDPDRLNTIDGVHLDTFTPPVEVYLRILASAVAVGALAGLLPAIRAYRAVRAA